MPRPIALAVLLFALAWLAPAARAENGAGHYTVENGSYEARPPAGWDGRATMPLLVFFHGYRQNGGDVLSLAGLKAALDERGVLLVAPNGLEGSWAHQGSPSSLRDENAFIDALLSDVERRWPVDPGRRWAAGFSQGGSMAWHAACFRGQDFTAFMPVSGAFWLPQPQSCPGGPVNLLHTHGTADTVVPMQGRAIRQIYHQGDVREGIAFWRAQDGCAAEPTRVETVGQLSCEIWSGCRSGREIRLCLHTDGHMIPKGWADMALDWAERVSAPRQLQASPSAAKH